MRIIPAIDTIDGKVVRLRQGDFTRKNIYHDDPLEMARAFEDAGLKYLHLVDLDGTKEKRIVNWKVLEKIATSTKLAVDFGGGIRANEDLKVAFESGAVQVTVGSVAVTDRDLFFQWLEKWGANAIILGADARDGMISTHGWMDQTDTGVVEFIHKYQERGVRYTICTDILKDGMLEGPAFELYGNIMEANPGMHVIASGGISSIEDLLKLKSMDMEGAIVGKAIYEGKIDLEELAELC
jgi:phosphoribosylformimino-5-aminoimidazole carboxamide ribotide isomerase